MEKWKGKIAVVTGGSSGIGAAIVNKFIENEITTIILDINEPSEILRNNLHFFKCDISKLESIKNSFKLIEEQFGFVNILINNAGIFNNIQMLDTSEEITAKIIKQVEVNFLGVVHCARETLRIMKKFDDFGVIINICSVAGLINIFPPPYINIYGPSKHAVRSFSEVLRQELAFNENNKIRITNLSPGAVKTKIYASSEISLESLKDFIPNLVKPEDIADGVVYILSTPNTVNVSEITIRALCEKM